MSRWPPFLAICVFFASWHVAQAQGNLARLRHPESTTAPKLSDAGLATIAFLKHVRDALGGSDHLSPSYLMQQGRVTSRNLQGTLRCEYHEPHEICEETLGDFQQWQSRDGAVFYRHDPNGLTHRLDGALLARYRTVSTLTNRQYLNHPQWFHLEGAHRDDAGLVWAWLQVPEGSRVELGFDAHTYLLRESRLLGDHGPETSRYDDWRTVSSYTSPWHMTQHTEHGNDVDLRIDALHLGTRDEAPALILPSSQQLLSKTTFRVPLQTCGEHLCAPVTISGHTYHFAVDSGTQLIVLDRRVADELTLTHTGDLAVDATRLARGMDFAQLPAFSVGDAQFSPQVVGVTNLGTTSDGSARIDGILGFPFFVQAALRFDAHNALLTIAPSGMLPMRGEPLGISLDRGLIDVATHFVHGPQRASMVLDTGSSAALVIFHPFAQRYPATVELQSQRQRTYGLGGSAAALTAHVARLEIPGLGSFTDAPAFVMLVPDGAFANELVAGSIGLGMLGSKIVNFDLQRNLVTLEAQSGP